MKSAFLLLAMMVATCSGAQTRSSVAVFCEAGVAAADTAAVKCQQLEKAIPSADVVGVDALPTALAQANTLVLPCGSAFPEQAWPAIKVFLQRGGNLLVLGGRPFTRPAYRDATGTWKLRDENYAYARALNLIDYQATPASAEARFTTNEEIEQLKPFSWTRAWSLVVKLSETDTSAREGAAGRIDARLTPLAWGIKDGRKLTAPAVQIDHFSGQFAGGRWVLVPAELSQDFFETDNAAALMKRASEGASDFRLQVAMPLLVPGEPIDITAMWRGFGAPPPDAKIDIDVKPERGPSIHQTFDVHADTWPVSQRLQLQPPTGTGFHEVTAKLRVGTRTVVYRTGFWMRDLGYLRSGPKLTVDNDFFKLDGRTLPVVGTTYMSSDAQRLFFVEPNPYVWDRDMAQIAAGGVNMLRTGWWSGWADLVENGVATEHTLRTMEAVLMTARRRNLPVQWTVFAFMPEVFGGGNPYLNPEAIRREQQFVSSLVTRFRDVPFLAWDLINEPSFDNPDRFWSTRPNGDAAESAAWNEWLRAKYGDAGSTASAWRSEERAGITPAPDSRDFADRAAYISGHPVAAYDFRLFAQEKFAAWTGLMREAIRAGGSNQLITVGQDEGGGIDRPSPAFYAPQLDFTTTHTWWLNDALLWDSLIARVPGKPMLTQETGFQREWDLDGRPRRNPNSEASVLEKKIAFALATGSGAIQWLWNVNSWMTSEQEVTIGAVRPDETEKPEAEVMRRFAKFAAAARDHLSSPELPEVAVVTSQALQYSALGNAAIEAQQRAVRVLEYELRVPTYVITENDIRSISHPKLAVLPSPQALSDATWQQLIAYVRSGGNLLITGSVERDDRWRRTSRLHDLGINAAPQPLLERGGEMQIGGTKVDLQFAGARQLTLESLRVPNGWAETKVGSGRIFVAAYPVELADDPAAVNAAYRYVLAQLHVGPAVQVNMPSSVLVRTTKFSDSVLYLLVSETDQPQEVGFTDPTTHAAVRQQLLPGHAVVILVDRKNGRVIAKSD